MANEVATQQQHAPANTAVALGNQIKEIVSGTPLEKEAMILAAMFQSGYFGDVQSLSQAITRGMIGKDMGLNLYQSLNGIYISPTGKIAMESATIRNVVKRNGYNVKTKELSNNRCVLEWYYNDTLIGESEFTKEDAVMAEYVDATCIEWPLKHNIRKIKKYNKYKKEWQEVDTCNCKDNYKKHPKDMLLARATSRGARMYADDAFGGQAVYDNEELDETDRVAPQTSVQVTTAQNQQEDSSKKIKTFAHPIQEAEIVTNTVPSQDVTDTAKKVFGDNVETVSPNN